METESSNNQSVRNKLTTTEDIKSRLMSKSSPSVRPPQKSTFTPPENWVDAPEIVPRWLATTSDQKNNDQTMTASALLEQRMLQREIVTILDQPTDCIEEHENDMELSFAVARSLDKTCGICYENAMTKEPASEQRFGILPSCNHCFCLPFIRRWRQARQFENKIIRACPECRVTSDFVCPSPYWVENKADKDKLIGCYKIAVGQKSCRYYRNGEGQCPFGNKCFYLHALPTGQVVDVGPHRRIIGAEGRVPGTGQNASLWDYLEEWELQWMDVEELMEILELGDASVSDLLEDLDVVDDTFDYWRRSQ